MEIIVRLEEDKDYKTVENVTREAFWNVYVSGALNGVRGIFDEGTAYNL